MPAAPVEAILASLRRTGSVRGTAAELGVPRSTVRRYAAKLKAGAGPAVPVGPGLLGAPLPRLPDPAPQADGPSLPDPVSLSYDPFKIDTPGTWLVLSDCHFPFHDRKTIELAVDEARRRAAVGVLLNGDVLDCAEVSEHERDPDSLDLADEVEIGRQFLAWLRSRLPAARLVYKEGNHDSRVPRYVLRHAPALFQLAGVGLPAWLKLADHGVEWVGDKRVIELGKLNVIHGHEYKGAGGVSPARWLYLKARSVVLCGHFHRTSDHHARNIRDEHEAAWSVGCSCFLKPAWLPLNDWNHGFAFVTVEPDGWFVVENKRVIGGRVV